MKALLAFFGLVGLVLATTAAFAVGTATVTAVPPIDPNGGLEQVFSLLGILPNAFKNGDHMLIAGALLAALTIGVRLWEKGQKVDDKWVPAIMAGLSALGCVSIGLMLHQPWQKIVVTAGGIALTGIGGWAALEDLAVSLIKKVFPKFSGAPPAPPSAPPAAPPASPAGG